MTSKAPPARVNQYGVIYSGSVHLGDDVAKMNLGVMRKLVDDKWLVRPEFKKIYILMDNVRNVWKDDPRVVVLGPSEASLRKVMVEIASDHRKRDPKRDIFNVNFKIKGHGAGHGGAHRIGKYISAETLVKVAGILPADVQRVFEFTQCMAASIKTFTGIRDANDSVEVHSGIPPGAVGGTKGGIRGEYNWTDGRALGSIWAKDVNGDNGIVSNSEMFWDGVGRSVAVTVGKILPLSRGFIYDPGPNYVDYGYGSAPAKPPFPDKLVEIRDGKGKAGEPYGLVDLLENMHSSPAKGITIYAFDRIPTDDVGWERWLQGRKARLNALAKKYKGMVQFVWVEWQTSIDFFKFKNKDPHLSYTFRFYGSNDDYYIKDIGYEKEFARVEGNLKYFLSGGTVR